MHISSKQKVQDMVGSLEDSAGNIIVSQVFLLAEDLNGYFSSVVAREDAKFPVPVFYLGQLIVTPEMLTKNIKAMKDNKSPGVDGIPLKLLNATSCLTNMFFGRYH